MAMSRTAAFNTPTPRYHCCSYTNETSQVQVLRIENIPHWFFERVVFPGERLVFQSPPAAQLEVYTGDPVSALLSDRITCDCL